VLRLTENDGGASEVRSTKEWHLVATQLARHGAKRGGKVTGSLAYQYTTNVADTACSVEIYFVSFNKDIQKINYIYIPYECYFNFVRICQENRLKYILYLLSQLLIF